jgi:hypothetical protein
MRRHARTLIVALVLPLLFSCAIVKDSWSSLINGLNAYQEPADGPRTRLRMSLGQVGGYRVYPAASCIDHGQPGAGLAFFNSRFHVPVPSLSHTKERRDLGVPGMALGKDIESRDIWLRTGQPVTLLYMTDDAEGGYHYSCQLARSFVPRKGVDYQAVGMWNGRRLRTEGCRVMVFELTPAGPQPVETRAAPMCSAQNKG